MEFITSLTKLIKGRKSEHVCYWTLSQCSPCTASWCGPDLEADGNEEGWGEAQGGREKLCFEGGRGIREGLVRKSLCALAPCPSPFHAHLREVGPDFALRPFRGSFLWGIFLSKTFVFYWEMEEWNIKFNLSVNLAPEALCHSDSPALSLSLSTTYHYLCPRFTYSQWVSWDKDSVFVKKNIRSMSLLCKHSCSLERLFFLNEKPACCLPGPQLRLFNSQKLLSKLGRQGQQAKLQLIWLLEEQAKFSFLFLLFLKINVREPFTTVFKKLHSANFKVLLSRQHSFESSAAGGRAF